MKRMVREKKDCCWRSFCEDSGLRDPWEVVRWPRDPWRMSERIGRLRGSNGDWLEGDKAMVDGLVGDVFGLSGADPAPLVGGGLTEVFPYSREEVVDGRSTSSALQRTGRLLVQMGSVSD